MSFSKGISGQPCSLLYLPKNLVGNCGSPGIHPCNSPPLPPNTGGLGEPGQKGPASAQGGPAGLSSPQTPLRACAHQEQHAPGHLLVHQSAIRSLWVAQRSAASMARVGEGSTGPGGGGGEGLEGRRGKGGGGGEEGGEEGER